MYSRDTDTGSEFLAVIVLAGLAVIVISLLTVTGKLCRCGRSEKSPRGGRAGSQKHIKAKEDK